jgi:hypothetical protein
MAGDEIAEDIVLGEQGGALQPILPSGLEDKSLPGGLLSPKEATTDVKEPTFSQMVSLLAAGECQHSGHCKMPIYAFTCVFLSCCKVSVSGFRILFLHSGLL